MKKLVGLYIVALLAQYAHATSVVIDNQTGEGGWRIRLHQHAAHHKLLTGKHTYDITMKKLNLAKWLGQGARMVCFADHINTEPYIFFKTDNIYQFKDKTGKLITCQLMTYGQYAHDWNRKFNKTLIRSQKQNKHLHGQPRKAKNKSLKRKSSKQGGSQ